MLLEEQYHLVIVAFQVGLRMFKISYTHHDNAKSNDTQDAQKDQSNRVLMEECVRPKHEYGYEDL